MEAQRVMQRSKVEVYSVSSSAFRKFGKSYLCESKIAPVEVSRAADLQ